MSGWTRLLRAGPPVRRDGASTKMKSAPGGLQAKDPANAPGWCWGTPSVHRDGAGCQRPHSAPGGCRGRPTVHRDGAGLRNPESAPGGRLGGPLAHREGAGPKDLVRMRREALRPTQSAPGRCRVATTLQRAATGATTMRRRRPRRRPRRRRLT